MVSRRRRVAAGYVYHVLNRGTQRQQLFFSDEEFAGFESLIELGKLAMKTVNRAEITELQQIPNVGPSIAANLRLIGVASPHDLLGKDPYAMYDELCRTT